MIFATGWASVAATYRDLERTETAEKIKESTVNLVDRSMDGLSKVLCPCAFVASSRVGGGRRVCFTILEARGCKRAC